MIFRVRRQFSLALLAFCSCGTSGFTLDVTTPRQATEHMAVSFRSPSEYRFSYCYHFFTEDKCPTMVTMLTIATISYGSVLRLFFDRGG